MTAKSGIYFHLLCQQDPDPVVLSGGSGPHPCPSPSPPPLPGSPLAETLTRVVASTVRPPDLQTPESEILTISFPILALL